MSKKSIYAEVYASRKESTENLSLKDSGYSSVEDNRIYEKIDHFKDDGRIYQEIDHFRRDNGFYDSGYSSVENKPIYAKVSDSRNHKNPLYVSADECKAQEGSVEQQESIYAKVNLSKKRAERKAKDIKANYGTYHSLVQDKVRQWQE